MAFTPRFRSLGLALCAIVLGLLVHAGAVPLGRAARDILGDALWAAMIVGWLGVVAPRWGLRSRALAAYGICAAVEFSQRLHLPALDAIRATAIGRLVLGSGFDARDLAVYAVGVALAIWWEAGRRGAEASRPSAL